MFGMSREAEKSVWPLDKMVEDYKAIMERAKNDMSLDIDFVDAVRLTYHALELYDVSLKQICDNLDIETNQEP